MPQPTTTGGGLMGYPTTVDAGGLTPQMLIPDGTDALNNATGTLTAGVAYFSFLTLRDFVTVAQMRCEFSGSPTGNCDMGIFDATGANGTPNNMLGHTTALAAVTGVFTKSLTANLPLSPGGYWLAWLDTQADTIYRASGANIGAAPAYRSSATNLTVLASGIAVTGTSNRPAVVALLSGAYS